MSPVFPSVLDTGLEVVVVSPLESEAVPLRRVLGHPQSLVTWFQTCRAALTFLREHPVGVVVSHTQLADGCWKDLLGALSRFTPPPNLIVLSRLADEGLWAEVLNLGGYDVLLTPFEREEALRVCQGAWRAWQRTLSEISIPRGKAQSAAVACAAG